MERLTYRNTEGRALLTHYGMKMYCSTQATADILCKYEEMIEKASSTNAEPVRATGFWLEQPDTPNVDSNKMYRCSVCGYADEQSPTAEVPYCWHCGSKMKKMPEGERR